MHKSVTQMLLFYAGSMAVKSEFVESASAFLEVSQLNHWESIQHCKKKIIPCTN